MAGHKAEQFVNKVDDNLLCPICKDVLQDPVHCKDGHSFCRYCIERWLRAVDRCPLDNNLIDEKNLACNHALRGLIDNLKVYCHPQDTENDDEDSSSEAAKKCGWMGKLQDLAKHEKTCPFLLVPCPHANCIVKVQRRRIKEHKNTCKYKIDSCEKCGCVLIRYEKERHLEKDCTETLIPCPYKCTSVKGEVQKIKRKDLNNHFSTVCGKALVDCPFKEQGCFVQVERQHVDKHVQENMATHMMLLDKQNTQLKNELKKAKVKSFDSYLWKIYDYHSLVKTKTKGTSFTSPQFLLCGHRWMLEVYPNGSTISGFGMILVRLYWIGDEDGKQYHNQAKVSATVRLEVLSVKPGNKDHSVTRHVTFIKTNDYWEWDRFIRSNAALSNTYCDSSTGILQIQCTIEPDQ